MNGELAGVVGARLFQRGAVAAAGDEDVHAAQSFIALTGGGWWQFRDGEDEIETLLAFAIGGEVFFPQHLALAFDAHVGRNTGGHAVVDGEAALEVFLGEDGFGSCDGQQGQICRWNFGAEADGEDGGAAGLECGAEFFGRAGGVVLAISQNDERGACGGGAERGTQCLIEIGDG